MRILKPIAEDYDRLSEIVRAQKMRKGAYIIDPERADQNSPLPVRPANTFMGLADSFLMTLRARKDPLRVRKLYP